MGWWQARLCVPSLLPLSHKHTHTQFFFKLIPDSVLLISKTRCFYAYTCHLLGIVLTDKTVSFINCRFTCKGLTSTLIWQCPIWLSRRWTLDELALRRLKWRIAYTQYWITTGVLIWWVSCESSPEINGMNGALACRAEKTVCIISTGNAFDFEVIFIFKYWHKCFANGSYKSTTIIRWIDQALPQFPITCRSEICPASKNRVLLPNRPNQSQSGIVADWTTLQVHWASIRGQLQGYESVDFDHPNWCNSRRSSLTPAFSKCPCLSRCSIQNSTQELHLHDSKSIG